MLSRAAVRFLDRYQSQFDTYEALARAARDAVETALYGVSAPIHVVAFRAKRPASLRLKLLRRRLRRPSALLYDAIGVRVITYHDTDVDVAVEKLKAAFDCESPRTKDKRTRLGLRSFGYRSVHLYARVRGAGTGAPALTMLQRRRFEIQVRSILEHAWAEIEHEVVYKGDTAFPNEVKRRWAALAGTIEILEHEFRLLKAERAELIAAYREEYGASRGYSIPLDVARLLALLEVERPDGLGWRRAADSGQPFAPGLENAALGGMRAAGVRTGRKLRDELRTARFALAARDLASAEGVPPAELSHIAVIALVLLLRDRRVAEEYLPDVVASPALQRVST